MSDATQDFPLYPDPASEKVVQGYEFPADLDFGDEAVFVLGHVRRNGAAYIEFDDSADDAVVREQLQRAAREGYFNMIPLEPHQSHRWVIIETDRFEVNHRL